MLMCVCVCVWSVLSILHCHLHEMSKYTQQFGCLIELMGLENIKMFLPVLPLSPLL